MTRLAHKLVAWFAGFGLLAGGLAASPNAHAAGVLTVAMTRGDLPVTTGNPDQGFEGFRFEVPPTMPYHGHPAVYKYDKAKARALLKEAGCLPCKITLAISTSGSGQMQSPSMNELVKQQLEDAGFQVTLDVMDWNAYEYESEQALMIFVVHDLNPRALSPKVHGFVQTQNWFQDLTPNMQIFTNIYRHVWAYQLNFVTSPFKDLRVRRAANYAVNRGDMKELLGGLMEEAYSTLPPGTAYYGHPVKYEYDPVYPAPGRMARCLRVADTLRVA